MEALFSTALAPIEAWLMFICVIVFFGVYLLDVVALAERIMLVLRPIKKGGIPPITSSDTPPTETPENKEEVLVATELITTTEGTTVEVQSPMFVEITPEEIQAHEAEKEQEENEIIAHQTEMNDLEEEVRETLEENPDAIEESIDKIIGSHEQPTDTETPEDETIVPDDTNTEIGEIHDIVHTEIMESPNTDKESPIEIEPISESIETATPEISEIPEIQTDEVTSESPINEETEQFTEVPENENKEELIEAENRSPHEENPDIIEEDRYTTSEEVNELTVDSVVESIDEESKTEQVSIPESSTENTEISENKDTKTEIHTEISEVPTELPSVEEIVSEWDKEIEDTMKKERVEREKNTERLYIITNEVKTLIARGNTHDARALIIQWLALEKNHRELNLILGSLYEWERQFQKAEYVYKDLALIFPEDVEILEKLANILIIERRYDIALEIYRKITSIAWESEWSLYIMTHLAYELWHNEELYAYARHYQKNWPNNPEILTLLAKAEIALGERQSAIQTLIKLKNLTPYNAEIMETIAKLTMEEELAGNFGGEKI